MLLDRGRVCIEKYERISFQDSFHSGAEQFTSMAFGRRQQQLLATATNLGNVCFWRQQQPVPIHSFIQETAALFIYSFIYFGSHHNGVRDWGTVTVVLLSVESMGNRQKSDPTAAGAADDEWQFIGLIGLSGGPIVQSVFTSQAVCVHNGTAVYLISEQQPRVAYRNQVRLGKIKKTNSNLKKYIRQGNRIHRH